MKKLFILLSLTLLTSFVQAQTVVSYDYSVSGQCFPVTVSVNFSTNNPEVAYFEVTAMFGGGLLSPIDATYTTSTSSNNLSLTVNFYTNDFDLVTTEYITINIQGEANTYELSSVLQQPYSIGVNEDFAIELVSNDNTITSVAWDFGDGSVVSGTNAITYQYQQTGDYIITCTIESATCGTVIRQKSIQVSNLQLDYPANICVGSEVTMTISGFNPNVAQFEVVFQTHSINVDANQPTFTEEFWYSGLTTVSVYGYDATQNFVEFKTFELDVNGEYYEVTPYWFMYAIGQTVNVSLATESGNPLDVTNVNWSNGMSGTSISYVADSPGYIEVIAEFINPCNNALTTSQGYVYVIEGQVSANTTACAPALINVSYTGDTIYGIMGIQLFDQAGNLIQSWPFAHEFDYQFDFGGQYIVRVSYALGDAMGQVNYPIYINGHSVNSASVTTCGSYLFGEGVLTQSGPYTAVFQTAAGCDSTVNLTLTVIADFNVEISFNAGVLSASQGNSFQWYNCSTGAIIPGATNSTYIPQEIGLYGVVATLGDCSDSTEVCFEVTQLNIDNESAPMLQIYPNPANQTVHINHLAPNTEIQLINQIGQVVHTQLTSESATSLDLVSMPAGVYFIRAWDQNGAIKMERLIVTK